tara:strand:- start:1915 stop:2748 length:834 start_codon:yes stop_codon:yes gene_type:complete
MAHFGYQIAGFGAGADVIDTSDQGIDARYAGGSGDFFVTENNIFQSGGSDVTISYWFYPNWTGTNYGGGGNGHTDIPFIASTPSLGGTSNEFRIEWGEASSKNYIDYTFNFAQIGQVKFHTEVANTSSNVLDLGEWHHLLFSSTGGGNSGTHLLYIDDVRITNIVSSETAPASNFTYNQSSTTDCHIYKTWLEGNNYLWMNNSFLDLTVESNRRKFITSGGAVPSMGTDGSTPTGSQPLIFWRGNATNPVNRGSASTGTITTTGTLLNTTVGEPVLS